MNPPKRTPCFVVTSVFTGSEDVFYICKKEQYSTRITLLHGKFREEQGVRWCGVLVRDDESTYDNYVKVKKLLRNYEKMYTYNFEWARPATRKEIYIAKKIIKNWDILMEL